LSDMATKREWSAAGVVVADLWSSLPAGNILRIWTAHCIPKLFSHLCTHVLHPPLRRCNRWGQPQDTLLSTVLETGGALGNMLELVIVG
jgi:hypothetical protein